MPLAPLLVAFLGLSLAGAQAPGATEPAPGSLRRSITVQLMTACDFPDVLGDQRVRVPKLAVKHVLGPRLVVVGRPRLIEIDRSTEPGFTEYDELLVLLPSAASLAREQVITVTGDVRTIAGARAAGVRLEDEVKDKKARNNVGWSWTPRRVVIVADSVETEDGVLLAGAR